MPEYIGIASIRNAATQSQQPFRRLQVWVPDSEIGPPEQAPTGLRYGVGPVDALGFARLPENSDPLITRKLNHYGATMGARLTDMSPVLVRKVGNDIRLILRADADKKRLFINEPTFGPDVAANFAQLVQALQPQIAALMTALHGQGSSLAHSADWVTAKLRQALKK